MGVELIKDHEGREHIALEDESFFTEDILDDNISSYQILKFMGEGENSKGKWETSKVQSNINNKLYFMKKVSLNLSLGERQNFFSIYNLINKNPHPNIIRHLKLIFQDDSYYIIDESLDCRDLENYANTFECLDMTIDEKTILRIFLQCVLGLRFIHKHDIIHGNIKLDNFMIEDNKNVKLGNFRYSSICPKGKKYKGKLDSDILFQSPEMLNDLEYDKKTDVFSLGVVFYYLCYYQYPFDVEKGENGYVFKPKEGKKNENVYSKELASIINLMLTQEEKDRPDINQVYDMIMREYVKYLEKNTSIEAVLRCMNSFKDFSDFMTKYKLTYQNEEIFPFASNVVNSFEDFGKNKEKSNCALYANNLRNLLDKDCQIDNDQEVNPKLLVKILLEKLNQETSYNNNTSTFAIQPEKWDLKEKGLYDYQKYYLENYGSIISQNFVGILKTKRMCKKNCKGLYSYYLYTFIELNLNYCMGKDKSTGNIYYESDIEKILTIQHNHCKHLSLKHNIFCNLCKWVKEQKEFKQYENFPKDLIFIINRGEGYTNQSTVVYKMKISSGGYDLMGVIKRMVDDKGEHFISINLDKDTNQWVLFERNKLTKVESPFVYPNGLVVMLFYIKK